MRTKIRGENKKITIRSQIAVSVGASDLWIIHRVGQTYKRREKDVYSGVKKNKGKEEEKKTLFVSRKNLRK